MLFVDSHSRPTHQALRWVPSILCLVSLELDIRRESEKRFPYFFLACTYDIYEQNIAIGQTNFQRLFSKRCHRTVIVAVGLLILFLDICNKFYILVFSHTQPHYLAVGYWFSSAPNYLFKMCIKPSCCRSQRAWY